MSKLIAGIDTSFDDTAIGIIDEKGHILENKKLSLDVKGFGGIVPELAARAHLECIDRLFLELIKKYKVDIICATVGPGLISSLIIGYTFASTYAQLTGKTFIPIHHLEGHIWASGGMEYPFLILIISGGHSDLYLCKNFGEYELICKSLDDAAGEVFDKVGRKYGLPFPSGPYIEELASSTIHIPPVITMKGKLNFSFSGLKTKTLRLTEELPEVASFLQESMAETIKEKLQLAMEATGVFNVIVCGGVAANQRIASKIKSIEGINCKFPPISLCTDNGAMIGLAGLEHYRHQTKFVNRLDIEVFSRMSLDEYYKKF